MGVWIEDKKAHFLATRTINASIFFVPQSLNIDDLKATLEGVVDVLFPGVEKRWNDDFFPFTEPSFELEVFYEGAWLEVREKSCLPNYLWLNPHFTCVVL